MLDKCKRSNLKRRAQNSIGPLYRTGVRPYLPWNYPLREKEPVGRSHFCDHQNFLGNPWLAPEGIPGLVILAYLFVLYCPISHSDLKLVSGDEKANTEAVAGVVYPVGKTSTG